jgi:hypothetical protein
MPAWSVVPGRMFGVMSEVEALLRWVRQAGVRCFDERVWWFVDGHPLAHVAAGCGDVGDFDWSLQPSTSPVVISGPLDDALELCRGCTGVFFAETFPDLTLPYRSMFGFLVSLARLDALLDGLLDGQVPPVRTVASSAFTVELPRFAATAARRLLTHLERSGGLGALIPAFEQLQHRVEQAAVRFPADPSRTAESALLLAAASRAERLLGFDRLRFDAAALRDPAQVWLTRRVEAGLDATVPLPGGFERDLGLLAAQFEADVSRSRLQFFVLDSLAFNIDQEALSDPVLLGLLASVRARSGRLGAGVAPSLLLDWVVAVRWPTLGLRVASVPATVGVPDEVFATALQLWSDSRGSFGDELRGVDAAFTAALLL